MVVVVALAGAYAGVFWVVEDSNACSDETNADLVVIGVLLTVASVASLVGLALRRLGVAGIISGVAVFVFLVGMLTGLGCLS